MIAWLKMLYNEYDAQEPSRFSPIHGSVSLRQGARSTFENLVTPSQRYLLTTSNPSFARKGESDGRRKEKERERCLSRKRKAESRVSPEHSHFVCLVPHGDTRCMGAAMRIIANGGTPLSNRRGVQGDEPPLIY